MLAWDEKARRFVLRDKRGRVLLVLDRDRVLRLIAEASDALVAEDGAA